jgi:signal transduction histidine kinase
MLYSWGQWNTPADYNPVDTPDGHICYDVIKSAGDEILVINNLPDTHYAQTDPNVIPYKLQTYVGRAVKLRDDYVGSLCVVYQVNIIPDEADKKAIEIIASAIGIEEERKRAEGLLRDSEEKYRHAQKMEALGIMAGGVAHDLNNVLFGIVAYPDLLLTQIPKDSPLIKPVLAMKDSGKKAAHIVQDLLTLARRGVVVNEIVNLNEIISEYLKTPEHEKLKSFHPGVEVETRLGSDLFNTSGSPVHLYQAVMNLVSNAAEAMPDGGKILISTENRHIDRPINGYENIEVGDYTILTVSDMGIGVSPEDKEVIFEPFYTKKVMGRSGTGLGMAVVWTTVKDHKGYIDLQSTEGKGTTFTLYFPATRRARAKKETILPSENYMGKGESILVVDDVRGQREIVFNLLTTLGYEVDTVSSGEEAVEYLKEHNVDLIILDMIMPPGIDGLDTYKEILELHLDQKAIIASGFSETDRVREAQRLGAGQYIKKPYTLEKIGIAVKDALRK